MVGVDSVYGQVGRPGVSDASTVPEPNQQFEEVLLGQWSISLAVQALMQGIRDEGEAVWRNTDVGAAMGVFEVPTYMPCYEVATTTGGGRSSRQEV